MATCTQMLSINQPVRHRSGTIQTTAEQDHLNVGSYWVEFIAADGHACSRQAVGREATTESIQPTGLAPLSITRWIE